MVRWTIVRLARAAAVATLLLLVAPAPRSPAPPVAEGAAGPEANPSSGDHPAALAPEVSAALGGTAPVDVIVHLRTQSALERSGDPEDAEGTDDPLAARRAAHAAGSRRLTDALAPALRDGRARRLRSLWLADALALSATPAVVRDLARHPDVRLVTLDAPATVEPWAPARAAALPGKDSAPLWNIAMVGADAVWERLGIDGRGVTVAVIDTGVDYHHPALQPRYRGHVGDGPPSNQDNWWCKSIDLLCGPSSLYPVDGVGHGTHVAGVAVAPFGVGVAPGAKWIAARVCPRADLCHSSWIVEALQWMLTRPEDQLPDVINASLTVEDRLLLDKAVRAIDDAGIVLVAASGNEPSRVRSPAIFPSVLAVGALTQDGAVWSRSGRGWSTTYGVKPDLVAPGVGITSTISGGSWARMSGTSMAAPHVSGAAALLLQAAPDLTPSEVADVLKQTATPLARNVPDPDSGYGRLNAYAAVRSVSDVGQLQGRVADGLDGTPITWARVRVATPVGDPVARTDVDDDGRYAFDLPPGDYLVVADAFTYLEQPRRAVTVVRDRTTDLDFDLEADEPVGYFAGTLADAESGARLDGEIRLEGVPERFTIPVEKHTGFSQRLPPATYRLRIAQFGYRVMTDTIKITAGVTLERPYRLTPAPTILLVDGDAWAYTGAIDRFRASLDRLGYVYHEWRVTDESAGPGVAGGAPSTDDLLRYDLVIWSSSITGPTFVHGARPISGYLEGGGRLILSGQDALCTDARTDTSGDPCNEKARPDPYVVDQLHLHVVRDSAFDWTVTGRPGGPLAGMTLTLNGGDSMDNQSMPDVLGVVDPLHTSLIADYSDGRGAAALVDTCVPHRAAALGFGFEGIRGAGVRDEVMGRLIDALTAPPPERGLSAQPVEDDLMSAPGTTADFTVTLHNTGIAETAFDVTVNDSDWSASLWSAAFTGPLSGPLSLGHCDSVPFGVRLQVPEGTARGSVGVTTVGIRSTDGVTEGEVSLRARTPAPVLVVDGDFARNTEARYLRALEQAGVAYDVWELGLLSSSPRPPPMERVAGYPVVVWFTGDDWRQDGSLNLESQRTLAHALERGGRLLFSSEDYLSIRGGTPYSGDRLFHEQFLGVGSYAANAGSAHDGPMRGVSGSALDGLTGCHLSPKPPGEDFSDRLAPASEGARVAMTSVFGHPVATQAQRGPFKSLFLAFDAGRLEATCADELMARALDWFSPLHQSRLDLLPDTRRTYASGDRVRLRLQLLNDGPRLLDGVTVRWTLPEGGRLDETSVPPSWGWDPATRALTWSGDIARNQRLTPDPEVVLTLEDDLPRAHVMTAEATIVGEGITVTRRADWRVNAVDLRDSHKSVPDHERYLTHGETAGFVITVRNAGTLDADAFVVTDTLPSGLTLIEDTVFVDSGPPPDLDLVPGGIVWRGSVEAGRTASLSYRARVTSYRGGWQRNHAVLTDEYGDVLELSAAVFARPRLLFPWAGAEVDPDP